MREEVLFYGFNQDNTCLAVGTKRGFRIYQCHPFDLICWADIGPISIVEMMYTSNILALVSLGDDHSQQSPSQRKLTIWDTKSNLATAEISFNSKIVKVKMNQDLIVVSTKDKIFIYKLNGLEIVDRLEVDNHLGRIILSPCAELNPYVAYSQSLKDGKLTLYDYRLQKQLKSIDCHKTPILKLAFSPFGNMIATCST